MAIVNAQEPTSTCSPSRIHIDTEGRFTMLDERRQRLSEEFGQLVWVGNNRRSQLFQFDRAKLWAELDACGWTSADLFAECSDETLALVIKKQLFPNGGLEEDDVVRELFYLRYLETRRLSGFLRSLGCRDNDVMLDVFQNVLTNLSNPNLKSSRLQTYDASMSFTSYFLQALRNSYVDTTRNGEKNTPSPDPPGPLTQSDLPQTVEEILEELPRLYGSVFLGMERDGKKLKELSTELRIPDKAVYDFRESTIKVLQCCLSTGDSFARISAPLQISQGAQSIEVEVQIPAEESNRREFRIGIVPLVQRVSIRSVSAPLPSKQVTRSLPAKTSGRNEQTEFLVLLLSFPLGAFQGVLRDPSHLSWRDVSKLDGRFVESRIVHRKV